MIEHFFHKLNHLDITEEMGVEAGNYANQFKKAYHKISLEDYLIAACAKSSGYLLWTNNVKHYPMKDIMLV